MLTGKCQAEVHTQVSPTPKPLCCPPPPPLPQHSLPPEVMCNCSFMSFWKREERGRGRDGRKHWTAQKLGLGDGFRGPLVYRWEESVICILIDQRLKKKKKSHWGQKNPWYAAFSLYSLLVWFPWQPIFIGQFCVYLLKAGDCFCSAQGGKSRLERGHLEEGLLF